MTPDERKEQFLKEECDRILKETLMDATELEKIVIKQMVIKSALRSSIDGYPARIHRMFHEIMHRFYCVDEGLEK